MAIVDELNKDIETMGGDASGNTVEEAMDKFGDAIVEKISEATELPVVTAEDEGNVLMVDSEGKWGKGEIPSPLPEVDPTYDNKLGYVLGIKDDNTWGKKRDIQQIYINAVYTGDFSSLTGGNTLTVNNLVINGIQITKDNFGDYVPYVKAASPELRPVSFKLNQRTSNLYYIGFGCVNTPINSQNTYLEVMGILDYFSMPSSVVRMPYYFNGFVYNNSSDNALELVIVTLKQLAGSVTQ